MSNGGSGRPGRGWCTLDALDMLAGVGNMDNLPESPERFQISLLDDSSLSKWNSVVEQVPEGTIFHNTNWLRIVERHTKTKLFPIMVLKGEEVVCVFPVYFRKRILSLLSSPHRASMVPYLGPLFPNYDQYKQDKKESILKGFQDWFTGFTRLMKARYVNIMFSPGVADAREFQWSGYEVTPLYTYIQKLQGFDVESAWHGLKKGLRKNISNAAERGVAIIEGKREDIDFIYSSVRRRLEDQERSLTMPKEYFFDLYDAFHPKNLHVLVAEYKDARAGGIITTSYNGRVSVWFGAVQSEISGLYPNDLLHWQAMKWAIEQGFREFEIIGANTPTISYFKSRYNLGLRMYLSATKYDSFVKYGQWASGFLNKVR
jgi:hypothetical protein